MLKPDLTNGHPYCTLADGQRVCTGARLGRGTRAESNATGPEAVKVTLQRVRINQGGYDSGGAYWGLGAPLYWACVKYPNDPARQSVDMWFRAPDRSGAKDHVRAQFPQARFYN